ncbi:MAG: hypothetical protein H6R26_185 [Proteobacteria bacterium]|nr:hypothetical protein [Pseudomonadota bacterium]
MPLKLFISYSHLDQAQLEKLLGGLRPLQREGLIAPWTDRLIEVGEDWRAAFRGRFSSNDRLGYIGFRLCLSSPIVDY